MRGRAKIKLAAECGYCHAMLSSFVYSVDGWRDFLNTAALTYGDLESIETLAVVIEDQITDYYEGNSYLDDVVKLWDLREKLHGHTEISDDVKEYYKIFKEKYDEMLKKSIINKKWSGHILRLDRETKEYRYGSWYNHYWNEVYEIKNGADKRSRGERIRIDSLTEDVIHFTFLDEKTRTGKSGTISLDAPHVCLRGESAQGGSNEEAWSTSDHVVLTLEEKSQEE